MTAILRVQHGTAEALARVVRFRQFETVQPEELDAVARFLLGPVGNPAQVLEHIHDELDQLWSLITEDYDDDQLDELTEDDWARHSFATHQQEVEHRHASTVARLVADIESHIALARLTHAEHSRAVAS